MTIFGKSVSEYIEFARLFLGLILLVGAVRLLLSLAGMPNATVKWFSLTAAAWIGVLYYAVRVHTSGFGSYRHLLPIYLLMSLTAQIIVIPAIVIAILSGSNNIYTAPEYSLGEDGKTWGHAAAHLFVGTTIGSGVSWLIGSLVMFLTRKLRTGEATAPANQLSSE